PIAGDRKEKAPRGARLNPPPARHRAAFPGWPQGHPDERMRQVVAYRSTSRPTAGAAALAERAQNSGMIEAAASGPPPMGGCVAFRRLAAGGGLERRFAIFRYRT